MAYIALDIGHGTDTRGKGVGNHKEHTFNSKLIIRLKERLEAHGHKVLLGQPPHSKEVSLRQRTDLYNREGVDIVLSEHANAGGGEGRCVFYWSSSRDGEQLAHLITNEVQNKGYSLHGSGLHASVPGTWTNMHITRETQMPAVLIENGFMDNSDDFECIFGDKQDEYIKDIAEAHTKAVQRYFGKVYQEPRKTVVKSASISKEQEAFNMKETGFKDVPADSSLAAEVKRAKELGITEGHGDGTFGYGEKPTKEQVVAMIVRAVDK